MLSLVRLNISNVHVEEEHPNVLLNLCITNETTAPVRVPKFFVQPDPWRASLEHAWKGSIPAKGGSHVFSAGADSNQTFMLQPGNSSIVTWSLLDDFDLPHPGTYYVQIELHMEEYTRNLLEKNPCAQVAPYSAEAAQCSFSLTAPLHRLSTIEAEAAAIFKKRHPIRTFLRRMFS